MRQWLSTSLLLSSWLHVLFFTDCERVLDDEALQMLFIWRQLWDRVSISWGSGILSLDWDRFNASSHICTGLKLPADAHFASFYPALAYSWQNRHCILCIDHLKSLVKDSVLLVAKASILQWKKLLAPILLCKVHLAAELQNLLRLILQLVPFIDLRCPFLLAFLCPSTLYMLRNPLLQEV